MAPHDEDVLQTDETRERSATLRSFEVVLHDKSREHVFAHFWDNENPAGHLNFFTVEPSGRKLIRDSFNAGEWRKVRETTTPEVSRRIDRIARQRQRRAAGEQGMTRQRAKTATWSIH